jgi:hypothetical protein
MKNTATTIKKWLMLLLDSCRSLAAGYWQLETVAASTAAATSSTSRQNKGHDK